MDGDTRMTPDPTDVAIDGLARRFCRLASATAAVTGPTLDVRWFMAEGRMATAVSGSLEAVVPDVDRAAVRLLGRRATQESEASVTGPSGIRYDVIDLPSPVTRSLLWILRPSPDDRPSRVGQALAQRIARFVGELRDAGIVTDDERRHDALDGLGALDGASSLSVRERAMVSAVLAGHRTSTIAREFEVSDSTVRSHLSAAFRKLGVRSQVDLIERFRAAEHRGTTEVDGFDGHEQ